MSNLVKIILNIIAYPFKLVTKFILFIIKMFKVMFNYALALTAFLVVSTMMGWFYLLKPGDYFNNIIRPAPIIMKNQIEGALRNSMEIADTHYNNINYYLDEYNPIVNITSEKMIGITENITFGQFLSMVGKTKVIKYGGKQFVLVGVDYKIYLLPLLEYTDKNEFNSKTYKSFINITLEDLDRLQEVK